MNLSSVPLNINDLNIELWNVKNEYTEFISASEVDGGLHIHFAVIIEYP